MTKEDKLARLRERMDALTLPYPPDAAEKLLTYQALLAAWNEKINLTGDASFDALLDRHLMDSLTPLMVDGLLPRGAAVIDVGSGAGLPGIPLAVVRPDLHITLLDSLKKRTDFLDAVIRELGLQQVSTVHARAEDAAHDARWRERFDIAAARAVASLPVLMELLLPFVKPGGCAVCFKGPSVEEEEKQGRAAAKLLGGGPLRSTAAALPYLPDYRHCLVIGQKLEHIRREYPRKAGTPAKNPLGDE